MFKRGQRWVHHLVIVTGVIITLGAGGLYAAHRHWVNYLENDGQSDVHKAVRAAFTSDEKSVAVSTQSIHSIGLFGAQIERLEVAAIQPRSPILSIEMILLTPLTIPDQRTFRISALGVGNSQATIAGTIQLRDRRDQSDPLYVEMADIKVGNLALETLVPILRHFARDTALTSLLNWMTGDIAGTLEHNDDRGKIRLVGNSLNMKKLHALLPALAIDDFDLGLDYNPQEMVFSKESRIHMANAEFGFRGGLRTVREPETPLWNMQVEVKSIPIVHALVAPIFGCPTEPLGWHMIAGTVKAKIYELTGSLFHPTCQTIEK